MSWGAWLENKWINGQSFDSILWLDGSFQYSENIDTRNELWWFQLSSKEESVAMGRVYCYVPYSSVQLIRVFWDWVNITVFTASNAVHNQWTLIQTIASWDAPLNATVFQWNIIIFTSWNIFQLDMNALTTANITPLGRSAPWWTFFIMPTLNFHETFLLVWNQFNLWRLDPTLWFTLGREIVRDFWQGNIVGIIQYDSQIWVTVNHNGIDSRTYILWGNFDADDIGVLWTIATIGISPRSTTQIGNRLFYFAQDQVDSKTSTLYEVVWTNPIKVWKGKISSGDPWYLDDFVLSSSWETNLKMNQWYPQKDKILYIPANDWIRTYGAKNENMIPSMERTFTIASGELPLQSVVFGDYLYVAKATSESRWNIAYRNTAYTTYWTLISRVHTWSIRWLNKSNKKLLLTYWMPETAWAGIRVSLRRNQEWFNLLDWWQTVANLTQADAVNPTWTRKMVKEINLTSGEDFRMDWNTLEYKIEVFTDFDGQLSPIFYETYLLYNYTKLP